MQQCVQAKQNKTKRKRQGHTFAQKTKASCFKIPRRKRPKGKVQTGPGVPCEAPPSHISKNFKKCILNYCCQWHPQLRARPHELGLSGSKTLHVANSSLNKLVILFLKVFMFRKSQGQFNLHMRFHNLILRSKKEG